MRERESSSHKTLARCRICYFSFQRVDIKAYITNVLLIQFRSPTKESVFTDTSETINKQQSVARCQKW